MITRRFAIVAWLFYSTLGTEETWTHIWSISLLTTFCMNFLIHNIIILQIRLYQLLSLVLYLFLVQVRTNFRRTKHRRLGSYILLIRATFIISFQLLNIILFILSFMLTQETWSFKIETGFKLFDFSAEAAFFLLFQKILPCDKIWLFEVRGLQFLLTHRTKRSWEIIVTMILPVLLFLLLFIITVLRIYRLCVPRWLMLYLEGTRTKCCHSLIINNGWRFVPGYSTIWNQRFLSVLRISESLLFFLLLRLLQFRFA